MDAARSCSTLEPVNLVVTPDSSLTAGTNDFGRVTRQWVVAQFKACVTNDTWQHRFKEAEYKVDTDFNFGNRTQIQSATDPAITDSNCRAVLRDFTPSVSAYGIRIAPYSSYIPPTIISDHEAFHVTDYQAVVGTPLVAWMDNYGRNHGSTQCKVPNPYQSAVADWTTERNRLDSTFNASNGHEVRAYAGENASLATLTAAIRARAVTEGWRTQCQ
ncbi:MAG: hypothetical protein IPK97_06950 [Ahniella sp.]|nr:hypothetical protein [Ahniella sp.]